MRRDTAYVTTADGTGPTTLASPEREAPPSLQRSGAVMWQRPTPTLLASATPRVDEMAIPAMSNPQILRELRAKTG